MDDHSLYRLLAKSGVALFIVSLVSTTLISGLKAGVLIVLFFVSLLVYTYIFKQIYDRSDRSEGFKGFLISNVPIEYYNAIAALILALSAVTAYGVWLLLVGYPPPQEIVVPASEFPQHITD